MTTYCLHFSPCGSTKSYAVEMADAIDSSYVSFDLTRSDIKIPMLEEDDIIVVAAPVYGGRVPNMFAERLSRWKGCSNKTISAVVYGNRAYDDALLELNGILLSIEMIPVASGAFLARHVFHPLVAQDRPNQEDFLQARKFAQSAKAKISSGCCEPVVVPGNRPYRVFNGMNIAPEVDDACIKCTTCADHCPTGAISRSNPKETDALLCINCMRCIENCPGGFRDLPSKVKEMLLHRLSPLVEVSRPNEVFL